MVVRVMEDLLASGRSKRAAGRMKEALADFSRAAALAPGDPKCLLQAAEVAYLAGEPQLALEYCAGLRASGAEIDFTDLMEARARFAGEHYLEVMARIHEAVKPRTYVEIGVERGTSLRLIKAPTLAIGIDPEPKLAGPLAPNQKVFAETSGHFFS